MTTHHTYEAVEILEDGAITHLRCPDCGKEVSLMAPDSNEPDRPGYQVLRDEHGQPLQGDFYARHSYSRGMQFDIQVTP